MKKTRELKLSSILQIWLNLVTSPASADALFHKYTFENIYPCRQLKHTPSKQKGILLVLIWSFKPHPSLSTCILQHTPRETR